MTTPAKILSGRIERAKVRASTKNVIRSILYNWSNVILVDKRAPPARASNYSNVEILLKPLGAFANAQRFVS
jgi:hypothetical protein